MRTHIPTRGTLSTSSMKLPMIMLAMIGHTTCGFSLNSSGPGVRPLMMKAPSRIATLGEPGIPRVNSGISAALACALFAVSGPATPSIAPWPKVQGRRETAFSTP